MGPAGRRLSTVAHRRPDLAHDSLLLASPSSDEASSPPLSLFLPCSLPSPSGPPLPDGPIYPPPFPPTSRPATPCDSLSTFPPLSLSPTLPPPPPPPQQQQHQNYGRLEESTSSVPVAVHPGEIDMPVVQTPPAPGEDEAGTGSAMNLAVGGVLAPVPALPPRQDQTRQKGALVLPSFEALGIAAPHPDRVAGIDVLEDELADEASSMKEEDATAKVTTQTGLFETTPSLAADFRARSLDPVDIHHLHTPVSKDKLTGRGVQSPISHLVDTLTPPAERGHFEWSTLATTSAMESPGMDLVRAPSNMRFDEAQHTSPISGIVGTRSWTDGFMSVLLEGLPRPSGSLSVLSHALPSPSANGHVFSHVVGAMHQSTPASETVWINVFHAIPGRFNLADLPTSPPATPLPVGAGEDYFTSKTFDSAVSITDYQEDLSGHARSPRPVVRPSSIDVSIVERYIPPTNSNEFTNLFNPLGPSILIDRLVELSPNNGSLVFIYPTKTGGRTFMREYLSPILDPVLRSVVVLRELSSDFSRLIGTMSAVDDLPTYETLDRGIRHLCARLSSPQLTSSNSGVRRFHSSGISTSATVSASLSPSPNHATFHLIHSGTSLVSPDRQSWARDWWVKQEKPRIRDIVARFSSPVHHHYHQHVLDQFVPSTADVSSSVSSADTATPSLPRYPKRSSSNSLAFATAATGAEARESTPTALVQQLLDEILKREYAGGQEPKEGIEVGVFIIRRTG